jgi:hypothetical protein
MAIGRWRKRKRYQRGTGATREERTMGARGSRPWRWLLAAGLLALGAAAGARDRAPLARVVHDLLEEELRPLSLLSLGTIAAQVAPRVFDADARGSEADVIEGVHPLASTVVDWFVANPIDAFEVAYQIALPAVRALAEKEALFELLRLYLAALARTDFTRAVRVSSTPIPAPSCPEESCLGASYGYHSDFAFVDPAFEQRGVRRKAGGQGLDVRPGTPLEKVPRRLRLEHYLVAIEKFFHRRGELFGMLAAYHGLRLCLDQAGTSPAARQLVASLGPRLASRYARFRAAFAAGRLAPYPYDDHATAQNRFGQPVRIPAHPDAEAVRRRRPNLPSLRFAPPLWIAPALPPEVPRAAGAQVAERAAALARSGREAGFRQLLAEMKRARSLREDLEPWKVFLLAAARRGVSEALRDQAIAPMRVGWRCAKRDCIEGNLENIAALAKAGLIEEAVKLRNLLVADNAADCVAGRTAAVELVAALTAHDAALRRRARSAELATRLVPAGPFESLPGCNPVRRSLTRESYDGICPPRLKRCFVSARCPLLVLR